MALDGWDMMTGTWTTTKCMYAKYFQLHGNSFQFGECDEGNTTESPSPLMIDRDEITGVYNRLDANNKWLDNTQFRSSVTKKTQVYISLMQEDEKISKKPYIPVNFLVVRVYSKRQRLWEVDKDDVVVEAAKGAQGFYREKAWVAWWLQPIYQKNPAHCIIVPNTEVDSKKDGQISLVLIIFTSERVDLVVLPKITEQTFVGK